MAQEVVSRDRGRGATAWHRAESLAGPLAPWLLFAGVLLWGWRVYDLWRAVPAYGDVLEVIWVLSWYRDALAGKHGMGIYSLAFHPQGWHVATYAGGPAMLLVLLPLDRLGGPAFAYNLAVLLGFAVAFMGSLKLARRYVGPLPGALAALLYTFWGFHWFRLAGHMNILLASALLPWMPWALERALSAPRRRVWLVFTGVIWGLMVSSSPYFAWMGAVLLLAWVGGLRLARRISWRMAFEATLLPAAIALVLSAPSLYLLATESAAAHAPFYDIAAVSAWDASPNSFVVPNVFHPWLQGLARAIYQGPVNEPGQANFGLLACLLAVAGLVCALRDRRWLPVVGLAGAGLLLSMGIILRWNGQPVQLGALGPLDQALWRAGHYLKPAVFPSVQAPAPFAQGVPLPGLLLSIFVPFWERARVFSRYALVASSGVFLLAALGLTQIRQRYLQLILAALLVFEVLPPPSQSKPFPPPPHPAFAWLAQQTLPPGEGVVDLGAWQPAQLYLSIGGETLWATTYHQKPTVAGASSVWPEHVLYLDQWLNTHPHPFQNPDFIPLLRYYRVHFILLHVTGGYAEDMLAEAKRSPDIQDLRCFDPSAEPGPWSYPICILTVPANPNPALNLTFRDGWAAAEDWGRWMGATEAQASWAALEQGAQHLAIDVFPVCVPGRPQRLSMAVNGIPVWTYQWTACENLKQEITIPASAVRVGWNEVVLRAAFAARPADIPNSENKDPRQLAAGFSRLQILP
jgi:hypothetical protein